VSKRKTNGVVRAKALEGISLQAPDDSAAEKTYPLLTDLLLPRFDDDKCTRVGASLRLRSQGSCWLVTIECPTEGVQTAIGVLTLVDVLTVVECALAAGDCNWGENWATAKKRRQGTPR
jgi:hypothetical protein